MESRKTGKMHVLSQTNFNSAAHLKTVLHKWARPAISSYQCIGGMVLLLGVAVASWYFKYSIFAQIRVLTSDNGQL